MTKIAVKGRGTAGAFGITHFLRWSDAEIDWYFDPNKPTQAVGESTNLVLPTSLYYNIGINYDEFFSNLNSSYKRSILKNGWGKNGTELEHFFRLGTMAMHVDCLKFQDYILNFVKNNNRVRIISENKSNDEIDADFILDCSGRPTNYDDFHISEYIPVNATHVIQCPTNKPKFDYTLNIARPYGWIFGVPLVNRCSMGYMYNKDITSLEDVKKDLLEVIQEYDLTPSEDTITFNFKNYYRKQNFQKRVVYNGNASFFIEPMEASSISMMDKIQRLAYDHWFEGKSSDEQQKEYLKYINGTEHFVAMHYAAGSLWTNEFWNVAQKKGIKCMERAVKDEEFMYFYEKSKQYQGQHDGMFYQEPEYIFWWMASFVNLMPKLGLYDVIDEVKRKQS